MRILSQDKGKYDLPYENIVLGKMMDCNTIYAYTGTGQPFKMAVYSSAEKIGKAMEMLRVSFENYDWIKSTGNSEELKQVARTLNYDEFKKMTTSYFQFPTDDEMEV